MINVATWIQWISLGLMLLGLYQPWWVLWWRPTQNRKQVLILYGLIALVTLLVRKFL